MRAITLRQPYASLIVAGLKTTETRDWEPHKAMWGTRIAIHAGLGFMGGGPETMGWLAEQYIWACRGGYCKHRGEWGCAKAVLPTRAVLCTVRLLRVETVDYQMGPHAVRYESGAVGTICPHGDYSAGRKIWVLDRMRVLEPPVPASGAQGLWNWTSPDAEGVLSK